MRRARCGDDSHGGFGRRSGETGWPEGQYRAPGRPHRSAPLTGTLICDADGLYDPRDFNDRMLLGHEGASSARLNCISCAPACAAGILSKARRGELIIPLPIGLAYDAAGDAGLDPDTSIQQALRHLFTTFAATGSAHAVVKTFNDAGLLFPRRHRKGPRKDIPGT